MQEWLEQFERLAENPASLAELDDETRKRIRMAAARIAMPGTADKRALRKSFRKREYEDKKRRDQERLEASQLRLSRITSKVSGPLPKHALPAVGESSAPVFEDRGELETSRFCYICKAEYKRVHHFYDSMCTSCGDLNFMKRTELADLHGTVAIVTGGRVKIGREIVLKLLRSGSTVVVTTRFPRDAQDRFSKDPDFDAFRDRLQIHGLDLRHTPSVEAFAEQMCRQLDRLDFIVNNACQTVRRPPAFYAHLLEREKSLPALASMAYDSTELVHDEALFPKGALDVDMQQIDLRKTNSWRLRLHEVPLPELLEVQLVNAVAPFVLNARLKELMLRDRTNGKHIVNVSAMEGQFNRGTKTDKHPHTNMAKAALNMMTRTSAQDYAKDGIYMNSVDTGWVTDEDPAEIALRKEQEGFQPPLDIVDGAARVTDPIISGHKTGKHVYGLFLKDYVPVQW